MKQKMIKLGKVLLHLAPAMAFGWFGCSLIIGEVKMPKSMLEK